MTGFGHAAVEADGIDYNVEVKTVNNRYLKAYVRLPDVAAFLESDVDKLLRSRICRGTVNYTLGMKNVSGKPLIRIDENVLGQYLEALGKAAGQDSRRNIDLSGLLTLPGVIEPDQPDTDEAEKIRKVVLELSAKAIDQLKEMRSEEGQNLADDLIGNCGIIAEKLELIGTRCPVVIDEYHKKLESRINELLAGAKLEIDADILARELAVYAERCDIAEEITRLRSHIEQFANYCRKNDNAGRRLDFIAQEMLREANTITSKSSDAQISEWAIDVKCIVDRIKEQVQNIE